MYKKEKSGKTFTYKVFRRTKKHARTQGKGNGEKGSKDEEKEIEVTFPEDYHAENLKGQKATL